MLVAFVPVIRSRQHPLVKTFRAVARGDASRALLDGWHLLREASAAGMEMEIVAVAGDPPTSADAQLIHQLGGQSNITIVSVSNSVMHALSPVRTPAGVAALMRRPTVELARLLGRPPSLLVVAIGLQDPGNAGAVIRSAEAGGATGVVLAAESADAWGWKALRAAMGSTFRLPVVQSSDEHALCDTLRNHGLRLVAAVPDDGLTMHEVDLRPPTALLFGGEGRGLSAAVLEHAGQRITIPMQRPVESLNVAVAVGVLVYEARRQRSAES